MKNHIFLFSAILAAASSAVAQTPVYSVNIVGIQKVDIGANSLEMAANPFVKPSHSLEGVLGSQLEAGLAPDDADNVYVFDTQANAYTVYFRYNNPNNVADPLNGKWMDEDYTEVPDEILPPGTGFFVRNMGTATNTVAFVGDVVSMPQITKTLHPGLNQVAYPYSSPIAINSLALKTSDGAVGGLAPDDTDNLFFWDQANNTYARCFLYYNTSNPSDPLNNQWVDEDYNAVADIIQPGRSFFYQRQASAPDLTWTEDKPY